MDANLVVNPIAGNRTSRSIKKILNLLEGKVSLTTFITEKKGDAFVFSGGLSNTDLIIVAGGDGTFNEVVNGVLSSQKPVTEKKNTCLALLPLGTTNVLAKELGIPEDIEKAVHLALTGTAKKISLGRINGRFFTLMAGIGFDGETVFKVKETIKKISGKGAYILSGINTLTKYNPPLIQVKTPEGTFAGYTAVVGNARCYGGYFQVTPRANLSEPLLDLCLFKGNTRKDLIRFVRGVIGKRHLDFSDVFYGKFFELEIVSRETVHIQIDGDYFGTLPAKLEVIQDAISLIW